MKRKLRNKISVLLVAAFLVCGTLVLKQQYDYQIANQLYETAQNIAVHSSVPPANVAEPEDFAASDDLGEPEILLTPEPVPMASDPISGKQVQDPLEENAVFLLDLNLQALRQTNEDVLGWIYIPDSPVDYPLIQVENNDEYLRRAWDGSANNAGCIFLECRNNHDFSDFNTLIYGHTLRNGKMFGSLSHYESQEYRDAHPFIYIVTDEWVRRYEVFSSYEANVISDTYRLLFANDAQKQLALDYYLESSVLETGLLPTVEDQILTLSTCMDIVTYDTRWVVQAVLTGEFPR